MKLTHFFVGALCLTLVSCEACNEPDPEVIPEIRWANDVTVFETASTTSLTFELRLSEASSEQVSVQFETVDGTAVAGEDYVATSATAVFQPGEVNVTVDIPVIADDYLEQDELFSVTLSNPINGYIKIGGPTVTGGIRNDDSMINISDEGYQSAEAYEGLTLTWADEFNDDYINYDNWGYDLGSGSGGWGNNELQTYTNSPTNSYLSDGRLIIKAEKTGENSYSSARMKSLGLQEFQFGRIDVRAILPKGKGIWPAIWMLGANYPEMGWPACGEIE